MAGSTGIVHTSAEFWRLSWTIMVNVSLELGDSELQE